MLKSKFSQLICNENGVALVTVILLGFMAMGLVSVAYHLATINVSSERTSARYSIELEASKGVSDYVMGQMLNNTLTCNSGAVCVGDADGDPTPGNCDVGSQIDIAPGVCNALGKVGCGNISACFLSSTVSGGSTYVAVNIQSDTAASAATPGRGERAIIDFVYCFH